MNTASNRRPLGPARPADIIIAVDQADARDYADRHGHTRYIAVTPRSRYAARGRTGPVYATRRARLHPRYAELRDDAAPAGATLPRTARDRRIA